MALPKQRIVVRPDSEQRIADLARKLLREADAAGILPTPIEQLYDKAKLVNVSELPDEAFLSTLTAKARGIFIRAKQKLRGIADIRERVVYTPGDTRSVRVRWVKFHELGHQVLPWHSIDSAYLDCDEQLSPAAKILFEQEANHFGSEVMFQGQSFRTRVRDYHPNFDAIFSLADLHAASRQATAWRFVEEQDEALALVQYYPGSAIDELGNIVLNAWCSVGSPEFNRKFGDIDLPTTLRTGHPWVAARDFDKLFNGTENFMVGGKPVAFEWHAWWNSYALLVMLRRKPLLGVVGSLIRR
jgi:hypothetical protein